jgi:hypothetical protein
MPRVKQVKVPEDPALPPDSVVREIRQQYATGGRTPEWLAAMHHLPVMLVWQIVRREVAADVP